MLPDTVYKRLGTIGNLTRQGKRINGLSRLMQSRILWEKAYAEMASNKGALTRGVTNNTLDGFSFERVENLIARISAGITDLPLSAGFIFPRPTERSARWVCLPPMTSSFRAW